MDKPSVLQLESLPDQGAEPFKQLLQESLQHLLEGQMTEFLGAIPGERTQARTGYRAGHVTRRLPTRAGLLELRVPRDRARRFCTDLLERYPRLETAFISELDRMAAQGLTTAKVSALAESLCGHALSAHALDQIQQGLHDALARHARGVDSVARDDGNGDGGSAAVRGSRVTRGSTVRAQAQPTSDSFIALTPAAVAHVAVAAGEREAAAGLDCTAPFVPDLDDGSFVLLPAHRGRLARWIAGLGGTLVAVGFLWLGMRWMGDAPPEFTQAAAQFSGAPDHGIQGFHAVHAADAVPAIHVVRFDPVDPTPAGERPAPAALVRAPAPQPGSHFQLTGVVATNPTDGGGLALIAIDGGLARVVRVGASVEGELSLQAVSLDRAMLGPAGGPTTLTLELGAPAASPRGVLQAEGAQRSRAAAVATALPSDEAETMRSATVVAGNMLLPMTVTAGDLPQAAAVEDLAPAAVHAGRAEFQGLSHSERRRLRRLDASR